MQGSWRFLRFDKNSTDLYDWSFAWGAGLIPPKFPVARRLCGSGIVGSSCAIENYEQSLIHDSTVCLDSSFSHEDNKSNNTEQAS